MAKIYNSTVRIRLLSADAALAMCDTLDVDEELQPAKITRELTTDGNFLIATFSATDTKMLKLAMSSFFDMAVVCTKTLLEFDRR